jgi:uncharacterized membrane protein YecN with MAPEG domain
MSLSKKQKGVLSGMLGGLSGAIALVAVGVLANPFGYSVDLALPQRLAVAANASLIPGASLVFCVARLAKHRFFTPDDIDGSALSHGSQRAALLQALLQNTLEQAVVAMCVYFVWATLAPSAWLSTVLLSAAAFGLGRVLFFIGYAGGAPHRALGFALTFYPSVLMGLVLLAVQIASAPWSLGP